jgi:hypothetical protein
VRDYHEASAGSMLACLRIRIDWGVYELSRPSQAASCPGILAQVGAIVEETLGSLSFVRTSPGNVAITL